MSASLAGNGTRSDLLRTNDIARRTRRSAGNQRVPPRRGRDVRTERNLARPDPAFEQRRHRPRPARGRHFALAGRHRDLHELLCLCEGRRRHRRPGRRRGAEGRRRAWSRRGRSLRWCPADPPHATAAPRTLSGAVMRNCLRVFIVVLGTG